MTNSEQQEALYEPFESTIIKKVQGMDYVPVAEVINRMNKVLGTNGWSSQIVRIGRDEHDPQFVICQVSVQANIDKSHIVADGVGGKEIALKRGTNEIVDLGNDFKSAYSDALKKACQRLGVGLHLARDDYAISHDVKHEVDIEAWNSVSAKIKENFSELQVNALREWWATHGNGPKPDYNTMTAELFEAYEAKAKAIARGVENAMSAEDIAKEFRGSIPGEAIQNQDEAPF